MGETICAHTQIKSAAILANVLRKVFNWDNIKVLTPEEEAKGKSLGGKLYGGKKEEGPTVILVEKHDLVDKQGRKGYWSDFIVTRNPQTGYLTLQWDEHNFDPRDKDVFLTPELKQELDNNIATEYSKEAIDEHLKSCPCEIISDWTQHGDYEEKIVEIAVEDIPFLPEKNLI